MNSIEVYKRNMQLVLNMMNCLERLNCSLSVMTRMTLLPLQASRFRFEVQVLNAKLDCDQVKLTCVGSGDDGRVLKVTDDSGKTVYAMKVFVKRGDSRIKDRISEDQAYREFKALKLVKNHPNFLTLYSEELDECLVREEGTDLLADRQCREEEDLPSYECVDEETDSHPCAYDAWAIRFNFLHDSKRIDRFWFYLGIVYNSGKPCINYTNKSILITHLTNQMLSALDHLHGLQIRHRDLDACNILIQLTSEKLHVYFVDFSRADLPDIPPFQYTESPNLKLDTGTYMSRDDVVLLERAYMMPNTINKRGYISAEKEPSDFRVLWIILKRCLLLDAHGKLLDQKKKEVERVFDEETFKLSLFVDMLFLIENESCINDAIDLTTFPGDAGPSFIKDEIKLCFDFFTGEARKEKTDEMILTEYNGSCIAISNEEKKKHNPVDKYWESCRCEESSVVPLWRKVQEQLNCVDTEESYRRIYSQCEETMEKLVDMPNLTRPKREQIMKDCFQVYKSLTWLFNQP